MKLDILLGVHVTRGITCSHICTYVQCFRCGWTKVKTTEYRKQLDKSCGKKTINRLQLTFKVEFNDKITSYCPGYSHYCLCLCVISIHLELGSLHFHLFGSMISDHSRIGWWCYFCWHFCTHNIVDTEHFPILLAFRKWKNILYSFYCLFTYFLLHVHFGIHMHCSKAHMWSAHVTQSESREHKERGREIRL